MPCKPLTLADKVVFGLDIIFFGVLGAVAAAIGLLLVLFVVEMLFAPGMITPPAQPRNSTPVAVLFTLAESTCCFGAAYLCYRFVVNIRERNAFWRFN